MRRAHDDRIMFFTKIVYCRKTIVQRVEQIVDVLAKFNVDEISCN